MQFLILITCVCFVVGATDKGVKNEAVSCSNIKPIDNVNVPQLRGSWVALESMSTTKSPGDRSNVCIHTEILNATSERLTMLSELHRHGDIDIAPVHFNVSQVAAGIWDVNSNIPQLKGNQFVVLTVDPERHLVVAMCLQLPGTGNSNKVLSSVTLLARRQDRGSAGHLTPQQLRDVHDVIAVALGIEYHPTRYNTTC